nr:Chitin synthase, class 2 [Polyrhizophydium stewartii]
MYQSPVAAASAYDTQGQSYSQQRYAGSEPSFAPVPLGQSASYAPQSSVDPHGEPHLSNETVFTQDPLQQYNYPPAQQFEPRRMGATLFRYKTVMTIPLTPSGNFVVEVPVPEKVFHAGKYRGREFSHLRYTAVVGDPDEFYERGYYLRQGEENRTTELFIVVTMYNEDEAMFLKTWKSLRRNIDYLCKKTGSPVWGPDGWKKIVVCLVSDGRSKIHQKTLATLGVLGVYQEGLIKTSINDQEEDTTHFPVQVLFCLKERNAKKINSHRWFFNAFGRILNPNVCVLIDVGTKPTERSLYYLWKEFDHNHNVAGACGEIYAEQGRCSAKLFNPLVAAQNFEYKMSNILDKPFESVFGFISVLPGAFSAYRYRALQHRGDGTGPLEKYFMGEKMHGGPNLTMANMYLAEDRILCFELVTKRDEAWVLRYVKRAKAETDVPDSVPEYISQRRRWLNGSFFAGLHAIIHFYQIFRSDFLSIRIVQQRITDPFFGFGGGMFITLRELYLFALIMIFIASLGNRPQGSKHLYVFCFLLFALIMATLLYMSGFTINMAIKRAITPMGQNSDGTPLSSALGFTRLLAEPAFRDLVLSMTSTYGVYLFASVMHGDPWHMLTSFVQYLLMLPSFVNILMVYAFCNLHDVSWGTKGDNKPVEPPAAVHAQQTESGQVVTVDLPVNQKDIDANYNYFVNALQPSPGEDAAARRDRRSRNAMQQEDYFKAFRTRVVLFWLLSNVTLLVVFTSTEILAPIGINPTDPNAFNPFLTFVLWSTAGLAIVRFIGSSAYICLQNRK